VTWGCAIGFIVFLNSISFPRLTRQFMRREEFLHKFHVAAARWGKIEK
jgi:hypothetical protein